MDLILFEDSARDHLLPLTFTRPVFALRAGIFTQQERWAAYLDTPIFSLAFGYLSPKYTHLPKENRAYTWVNGRYWPSDELIRLITSLAPGEYAVDTLSGELIGASFSPGLLPEGHDGLLSPELLTEWGLTAVQAEVSSPKFAFPQDIFRLNAKAISLDIELIRRKHTSQSLSDPHTRIYGADNIFVAEGVKTRAVVINAEDGPVYLGPGSEMAEGSLMHGSHALGAQSKVAMGAKLRGDSAFGPYVKVGGEVGNSVIMGYSNKGHEGYLGNSVLGYWCNLGADTNTSNLKNNYTEVRIWNYPTGRFRGTGSQFCGLIMGDHSKCGINTMFNTGTVVGVSANIFGAGYPRNFIPSFSWGGAAGFKTFQPAKAYEVAELVMKRRNTPFDEQEKAILAEVFSQTAVYRRWEKA